MERSTLLIYLRDVRDLEMAKYYLNMIRTRETNQHNKMVNSTQAEISAMGKQRFKKEPELERWSGPASGCLVLTILCFILLIWLIPNISAAPTGMKILMAIPTIFFGALTIGLKPNRRIYEENLARVKRENEWERQRLIEASSQAQKKRIDMQKKTEEWNKRSAYLNAEYTRISDMLENAYDIDVLPRQYRNLQSAYYIYDYMSTSQATLEETLFHEHIENGIQRILAKLDIIIAQNEEIIFQNRRIEANTREISENTTRILEGNQRMLESQERTEQNSLEAAKNAAIAANYAEVNAFFSTAIYLESQRR